MLAAASTVQNGLHTYESAAKAFEVSEEAIASIVLWGEEEESDGIGIAQLLEEETRLMAKSPNKRRSPNSKVTTCRIIVQFICTYIHMNQYQLIQYATNLTLYFPCNDYVRLIKSLYLVSYYLRILGTTVNLARMISVPYSQK